MLYRNLCGEKVSWLGLGNMRLPTTAPGGPIDREKASELIAYAYQNGINYFDTAYRYHEGESERFVGEVLSKFPRDTFYLATKFPGHMMEYENGKFQFVSMMAGTPPPGSIAEVFEKQLRKCKVDFFDFYLLHNIAESSFDFYTDEEIGAVKYFIGQKKRGRIKHLGFSAHGRAETIEKFLDHYDGVFEFAQIQLNYIDWILQGAKEKYEVLKKKGLPVIAMEPVRGGGLANMKEEAAALFRRKNPGATVASWALRWLQDLDGAPLILSGMSNMEQLKENIALYSVKNPLSEDEKRVVDEVVHTLVDIIPCTTCRYCVEGCPQKLNIPALISMYNESGYGRSFTLLLNLGVMKPGELPAACTACGSCARVCPQGIDIPGVMAAFAGRLEHMR